MNVQQLPVVSAMVGAGGTAGAVIALSFFYRNTQDDLRPYRLHALYVLFWALTVLVMRWDHLGSIWSSPEAPQQQQQQTTKDGTDTGHVDSAKEVAASHEDE